MAGWSACGFQTVPMDTAFNFFLRPYHRFTRPRENMTAENLVVEDDMNMMDLNAVDGMNATENAVMNDLTTNDADTNLANGY